MSNTVYFPKTELYPYERQWDLKYIWSLADKLDIEFVPVKDIWEQYRDQWCWGWEGEEIDNESFLGHVERVMQSDLNYPIILSEEGYIFDGVHRLIKAKYLGLERIHAVKFVIDPGADGDVH